jgi:uncharacterized surface protein with fasciclin (FAS1) repeats
VSWRSGGQKATISSKPQTLNRIASASGRDITENAYADVNFTMMFNALKAADLIRTFKGAGPFTFFAPTNTAFGKLAAGTFEALVNDKARLAEFIKFHVLPIRVSSRGKASHDSKSMLGNILRIVSLDGQLTVDGAKITTAEINSRNGVLYGIDTVLLQP